MLLALIRDKSPITLEELMHELFGNLALEEKQALIYQEVLQQALAELIQQGKIVKLFSLENIHPTYSAL